MTLEEKDKGLAKGLGRNLRYLREQTGMSQTELAVKFDVSQSTIAAWESGSRYPGLYHLHCIHDLFQVDLDRLIYGQVKPPTPMYARNLQYLRKKHGITQIELAHLLGINTESAHSKIENASNEPQIGKLRELADFFGVTMDQIVKQDLSQEVSK